MQITSFFNFSFNHIIPTIFFWIQQWNMEWKSQNVWSVFSMQWRSIPTGCSEIYQNRREWWWTSSKGTEDRAGRGDTCSEVLSANVWNSPPRPGGTGWVRCWRNVRRIHQCTAWGERLYSNGSLLRDPQSKWSSFIECYWLKWSILRVSMIVWVTP